MTSLEALMPEFDDVLTQDHIWWQGFAASLKVLEDWSTGQLAVWTIDDLLGTKTHVPCPRRGLHARVAECWLCWTDVAFGYATASQVLAPEEVGGAA